MIFCAAIDGMRDLCYNFRNTKREGTMAVHKLNARAITMYMYMCMYDMQMCVFMRKSREPSVIEG